MRILIYDVETANPKDLGSICAVGWISLDNDEIVASGYSLINPKCSFSRYNTQVHGITAEDVKDAPCFAEYWRSTLGPLMTSHLVVAHSAGFDMSATEQALYNAGIGDCGIDYIDSLRVFQAVMDSESYKLSDLAEMYGYYYDAHNAAEDVKALLYVLSAVASELKLEDIAALLVRAPVLTENTLTNHYQPKRIESTTKKEFPKKTALDFLSELSASLEAAKVKGTCFCGQRLCITGDVPGYERSDVERIIIQYGGRPTSSVSGKTNYLIVGTYEDRPSDFISTKHQKALDLIDQGKDIRIISPEEFFDIIKEAGSGDE